MEVDRSILSEALSAITEVSVKLESDYQDSDKATELKVTDLPEVSLLKRKAFTRAPLEYITQMRCGGPKKESTSVRNQLMVIPDDFFDPAFDFDFTDISESGECTRGGEPYTRPYGWMRFALKVRDKYPDGNDWLGTEGWRNRSSPGEWPVCYHGTGKKGAEGVIQTYFKAGPREVYGRGIYSTPDIKVANEYATSKTFTSQTNGKTYKVIVQSRIKPQKREIKASNIWLIPIPEGSSAAEEGEILRSSIRPYGLLLKRV